MNMDKNYIWKVLFFQWTSLKWSYTLLLQTVNKGDSKPDNISAPEDHYNNFFSVYFGPSLCSFNTVHSHRRKKIRLPAGKITLRSSEYIINHHYFFLNVTTVHEWTRGKVIKLWFIMKTQFFIVILRISYLQQSVWYQDFAILQNHHCITKSM